MLHWTGNATGTNASIDSVPYYVSGTVLSALHLLTSLILTIGPMKEVLVYYYPPFYREKTEHREVKQLVQSYRAGKWWT